MRWTTRGNGRAASLDVAAVFLLLLAASAVQADVFGSGENRFEIEFVRIGNPGNPPDTTGDPNPAGSVPYVYRIGKYEVPEHAVRKANAQSALEGTPLNLSLDARGPNKPATSLSWFEAARFVNWLNTSTGSMPAYKFDAAGTFQLWQPGDTGFDPDNRFRNKFARYFLPSTDEWYKAAFYDPAINDYWDYPTGSNDPPMSVPFGTAPGTAVWNELFEQGPADVMLAGGPSPYRTIGQGGNVYEWEETQAMFVNDSPSQQRGVRGGDWIPSINPLELSSAYRGVSLPDREPINVGLRIACAVPEPHVVCLVLTVLVSWMTHCRRRRVS